MEQVEKTAPEPTARRRWRQALAGLLWVGLIITAGICSHIGTKPEPAKQCQLHHVMMKRTRVPVMYYHAIYISEDEAREYPNAPWCVQKKIPRFLPYQILMRIDPYDWVWICPKCYETRVRLSGILKPHLRV